MADIVVTEARDVAAPPRAVHAVFADYRVAHPAILPKRAFLSLVVEKGGTGAGTIFRLEMKAFGAKRTMRAEVTEPEPGRRLVETDLDTGLRTTFGFEPLDGGARTRVTLRTEWTTPGLRGWLERRFAPRFLRKVYAEELANLARAVEGAARPAPA